MNSQETLRTLIRQKQGAQSMRKIAKQLGISPTGLWHFLEGTHDKPNVETCLRLSAWLETSPTEVLRMAGHEDIAALFETEIQPQPEMDSNLRRIGRELTYLTNDDKRTVADNAVRDARKLREVRESYETK